MGCLPYLSRLKRCLRGATPTNPCQVRSLQYVSLTHPGWNGAYRNPKNSALQYALFRMFLLHIQAEMVPTETPSKKQCPVCYIQDVSLTHPGWNGAYGKHLPQSHAQNSLYVSLTHQGSNGAYGELSQTHAHFNIYWMFLLHIQAEIAYTLNYSHKPMPSMLFDSMFLLHLHA